MRAAQSDNSRLLVCSVYCTYAMASTCYQLQDAEHNTAHHTESSSCPMPQFGCFNWLVCILATQYWSLDVLFIRQNWSHHERAAGDWRFGGGQLHRALGDWSGARQFIVGKNLGGKKTLCANIMVGKNHCGQNSWWTNIVVAWFLLRVTDPDSSGHTGKHFGGFLACHQICIGIWSNNVNEAFQSNNVNSWPKYCQI